MILSKELKILGPFYLERFISHLLFFLPAYWIVYFNQTLSLWQIGILMGAWSLSAFVFEIPTGAFADIYGRKISTLTAYFFKALLLPMFIFIHNFYLLIFLFIIRGFLGTLNSGARESWIMDNLKFYKLPKLSKAYFLKEHSLVKLGMFLSGFLGTLIVNHFGLQYIWLFGGLSWMLSFLLLLPVKEHKIIKKQETLTTQKTSLLRQTKTALVYIKQHKNVLFLILAGFFFVFTLSFSGDVMWQPLLKESGFPVYALGTLFSISMLIGSITAFIGKFLLNFINSQQKYLIFALSLQIIVASFLLLTDNLWFIVAVSFAMIFATDLFKPIYTSFFQEFIPSKQRATISSVNSMFWALAFTIARPFAGFTGSVFGAKTTVAFGVMFLIPVILFINKTGDKSIKSKT